jgi:hypothetical protein
MLFSYTASASMAPSGAIAPNILQLRLASTDPVFGEGHHSNGCIQMTKFLKGVIYLTKSQAYVAYTTITPS